MNARESADVREAEGKREAHGKKSHAVSTPWVSAEELQPPQRPQVSCALDEVDEALLGSFPCSDPPCYTHSHA